MKYKMIVLDLDGTLLDDNKKISDLNVSIIEKLHASNVMITIATGRNYFMAKTLTERIKHTSPFIIANNGSVNRYSKDDDLFSSNYLNPSCFEYIYKEGLKKDLNPIIHIDDYKNVYDIIYELEDYENAYYGYIKKDYTRAKRTKFYPPYLGNILSVCYYGDKNIIEPFYDEMKAVYDNKFNIILNRNISERSLLEFLHIEASKWTSLDKYLKHMKIKKEEVVAIGDDNNDLELIFNSGLGIAMKNATDECKSIAKCVSAYDNNNSAIYHELSKIFEVE